MGDKPTRAEQFWQAERARKVPRSTRLGTVFEVREASPAARLMQPGAECRVDAEIRKAIDRGFLVGALDAIRADLVVVWACAWGEAGARYKSLLTEPARRDRQERAARLAAELRAFVDQDDAYDASEFEEKMEVDVGAADLAAMVEHGRALIALLDAYAERGPTAAAPATDHLQREYFREFDRWWRDRATGIDRRGAKAVRNRIAIGLWLDMGQEITNGYADEEFARYGFSKIDR